MKESIFDKYGGIATVSELVYSSYEDILGDPTLHALFEGVNMEALMVHQIKFFSHILGGPAQYEGRALNKAHLNLKITEEQFDTVVRILTENLQDLGIEETDLKAIVQMVMATRSNIVSTLHS